MTPSKDAFPDPCPRAPLTLARLRNPPCQHSEDEIAKALPGTWRAEPLFALRQAVELQAFYHQQLTPCDQQIKAHLATFADRSDGQPLPPTARRHKKANAPRFDARTPLYRLAGVALTTIEGIEEGTALVILSEIGTDMSRWPSVQHVCSWLGLSPQHKIAGGTVLSRRVSPRARSSTRARRWGPAIGGCAAAWEPSKAITATAHTLARLVCSL